MSTAFIASSLCLAIKWSQVQSNGASRHQPANPASNNLVTYFPQRGWAFSTAPVRILLLYLPLINSMAASFAVRDDSSTTATVDRRPPVVDYILVGRVL